MVDVEVSPNDFVVLVMGETGAGKTTFIQKLIGRDDIEIGHRMESGTTEVKAFATEEYIAGKRLVLVDTPGVGSADLTDVQVVDRLAIWLAASYQHKVFPSGALLLQKADAPPSTHTYRRQLLTFRKICGDSFLKNIVLVTTMWNKAIPSQAKWVADLKDDGFFWRPLISRGAKTARFDNTQQSARDILKLLEGCQPKSLLIQHQLVEDREEVGKTSAGKRLVLEVEEEIREHSAKIEKSTTEKGRADPDAVKALDRSLEERKQLKQGFWKRFLRIFGIK